MEDSLTLMNTAAISVGGEYKLAELKTGFLGIKLDEYPMPFTDEVKSKVRNAGEFLLNTFRAEEIQFYGHSRTEIGIKVIMARFTKEIHITFPREKIYSDTTKKLIKAISDGIMVGLVSQLPERRE